MKKWIWLLVLGIISYAVYAYAFTPGRDNQPVTVTSGTVVSTPSGTQDVNIVEAGVGTDTALKVDGSGVTQPVSGTVGVSNIDHVGVDTMPTVTVTGAVTTSGTVTATISDSTPTDTWIDLTLTDTATEYSITLPANTIAYEFQCRTSNDVRWGNTTELATTYWTMKAGTGINSFAFPNYNYSSKVLYFYSPTVAGLVIEYHAVVKP